MSQQVKICITGGIGSGKSVVSRILRLKGFQVYDCDFEAKRIMDTSQEIICKIRDCIGSQCIDSDGKINRKALADIIFTDNRKRRIINSIVHEAVRNDFNSFCENSHEDIIFIETAIPTTAMISEIVDHIWLITAPEEIRINRVKERNAFKEIDIIKRIVTQRSEFDSLPAEKTSVIANGGNDDVLSEITVLISTIEKTFKHNI